MIDIEHDSAVPIHEQVSSQIMAHVASGGLKAGAKLPEYRAFAQRLLTNPQVIARAYAALEQDGVLKDLPNGEMEIVAGADVICRVRLQDRARQRLRRAVAESMAFGLPEAEIRKAVDEALAIPLTPPLTADEVTDAIKKPSHATSHRSSQGIQVLPGQKGRRSP